MKILYKIVPLVLSFILFSGCKFENSETKSPLINGKQLYTLIISALDSTDNKLNPLNSFFNNIKDRSSGYNKINVDSNLVGGRKIYSILLEHPIPAFNLFGLIDDSLNLLLKDASLNGYINYEWKNISNKTALSITEEFKSYEVYNLKRYSLYFPDSLNFKLVFRTFTFFSSPKDSLLQIIAEITDNQIKTLIPKTKFSLANDSEDLFLFDEINKKFVSEKNIFEKLLLKEINDTKLELSPNHLLNKKSVNDILEYSIDSETYISNENDYDINIPATWAKIINVSLSKELNKNVKGIYYINQQLGSSIGIIKIPLTDSAENYVNDKFRLTKEIVNYKVRETELKQDLKRFHKAIEHFCGNKKYLLILEGSKNIYKSNEAIFNDIISSFKIKC